MNGLSAPPRNGTFSMASLLAVPLAMMMAVSTAAAATSQPLPEPARPTAGDPPPPRPRTGDFDWIQLKNGEWLKGEIEDLQDESFSFESDELDTLQFDWDDVYTVYSPRSNTCVFEDRTSVIGKLRVDGKTVTIVTDEGEKHYDREDLRSIIPGGLKEQDHWSGKWSVGLAIRRATRRINWERVTSTAANSS